MIVCLFDDADEDAFGVGGGGEEVLECGGASFAVSEMGNGHKDGRIVGVGDGLLWSERRF